MLLEELTLQHYNQLNDIDVEILHYILNNQEQVLKMGTIELAKNTNTSKSTITRTAKKIGFNGYSELKYFLREQLKKQVSTYESAVAQLQSDIVATLDLAKESNLEELVESIYNSENIYCYATGNFQQKFAEIFSQQLISTGKKVIFITEESYLELIIPILTQKDMVILFSLSGETETLKPFILKLNTRRITLTTITENKENYFSKHANHSYYYYSTTFDATVNEAKSQQPLTGLMIFTELLFRTYLEYIQKNTIMEN